MFLSPSYASQAYSITARPQLSQTLARRKHSDLFRRLIHDGIVESPMGIQKADIIGTR